MTHDLTPIPQPSEIVAFLVRNLSHVDDQANPDLKKRLQRMRTGKPLSVDAAMDILDEELTRFRAANGNDASWDHDIRSALEGYIALCLHLDCGAIPAVAIRQLFDRIAAGFFFALFDATLQGTGVSADEILGRPATAKALLWQSRLKDGNPSVLARELSEITGLRREGEHWDRLLRGWIASKHKMRTDTILRLMEHWDQRFGRALLLAHLYENYCKLAIVDPSQHTLEQALPMNLFRIRHEIEDLHTGKYATQCELSPGLDEAANILLFITDPNRRKEPGDAKKARDCLAEIDLTLSGQSRLAGLGALRGRYFVQMGLIDEALEAFESAANWFLFRSAEQLKTSLRHLLIVAAARGKKTTATHWKGWAEALELQVSIQDPAVSLMREFPYPFPQAESPQNTNQFEKYVLNLDEWRSRKPDLRNPNRLIKGFGPTPTPQLALFASLGKADKVNALLDAGADPEMLDASNGSAVLCAIQEGDDTCVGELIAVTTTQTINTRTKKGHSPLHEAISKCRPDWVQALIAKGADIELPGRRGQSPLYNAVSGFSSAKQLLFGLCDPNAVARNIDRIPAPLLPSNSPFVSEQTNVIAQSLGKHPDLMHGLAKNFCRPSDEHARTKEILTLLLEAGADPNQCVEHHEMTPFLYAAEIGDEWLLKTLLDHGANIRSQDDRGATAFVRLHWFGHSELATRFLSWVSSGDRLWLRQTPIRTQQG
ncbi:MAG: ankyrin repeat domain-containing protein [Thioclava sp.]|nr:ankyrin repeat domain-containing protein [Thioclava sp.]MBD3804721.1 ankyrin repeat domain-containing protein [Thioclava sp.]